MMVFHTMAFVNNHILPTDLHLKIKKMIGCDFVVIWCGLIVIWLCTCFCCGMVAFVLVL